MADKTDLDKAWLSVAGAITKAAEARIDAEAHARVYNAFEYAVAHRRLTAEAHEALDKAIEQTVKALRQAAAAVDKPPAGGVK